MSQNFSPSKRADRARTAPRSRKSKPGESTAPRRLSTEAPSPALHARTDEVLTPREYDEGDNVAENFVRTTSVNSGKQSSKLYPTISEGKLYSMAEENKSLSKKTSATGTAGATGTSGALKSPIFFGFF